MSLNTWELRKKASQDLPRLWQSTTTAHTRHALHHAFTPLSSGWWALFASRLLLASARQQRAKANTAQQERRWSQWNKPYQEVEHSAVPMADHIHVLAPETARHKEPGAPGTPLSNSWAAMSRHLPSGHHQHRRWREGKARMPVGCEAGAAQPMGQEKEDRFGTSSTQQNSVQKKQGKTATAWKLWNTSIFQVLLKSVLSSHVCFQWKINTK